MATTAYRAIEVYGLDRLNDEVAALVSQGYSPIGDVRPLGNGRYVQTLAIQTESAGDIAVEAITTVGGVTIPAGTLQETLQAIADLASPGTP